MPEDTVLFLHVCFEYGDLVAGIVANDSTLGAVEAGAHGVVALAADGDEDLAYDIVGKTENGDSTVINGPVGKTFMVRVGSYLGGVTCDPAQEVYCMAAASQKGLPEGVNSPIVGATGF